MSRLAIVLSVERVQDDGGHGVDVKCDPSGGNLITAPHFTSPGEDSLPLAGDSVGLSASSDSAEHAAGYADTRNTGVAQPGEKRIYARDADGVVVASVYLRGDGKVEIEAPAGLTIRGDVRIEGKLDTTGAIAAAGAVTADGAVSSKQEVTAKAGTPGAVKLSTHSHLSGTGPTQPPTPGT